MMKPRFKYLSNQQGAILIPLAVMVGILMFALVSVVHVRYRSSWVASNRYVATDQHADLLKSVQDRVYYYYKQEGNPRPTGAATHNFTVNYNKQIITVVVTEKEL